MGFARETIHSFYFSPPPSVRYSLALSLLPPPWQIVPKLKVEDECSKVAKGLADKVSFNDSVSYHCTTALVVLFSDVDSFHINFRLSKYRTSSSQEPLKSSRPNTIIL